MTFAHAHGMVAVLLVYAFVSGVRATAAKNETGQVFHAGTTAACFVLFIVMGAFRLVASVSP